MSAILSNSAVFLVQVYPACTCCIRWDDPGLAIAWPLGRDPPLISGKDEAGSSFREAVLFDRLGHAT